MTTAPRSRLQLVPVDELRSQAAHQHALQRRGVLVPMPTTFEQLVRIASEEFWPAEEDTDAMSDGPSKDTSQPVESIIRVFLQEGVTSGAGIHAGASWGGEITAKSFDLLRDNDRLEVVRMRPAPAPVSPHRRHSGSAKRKRHELMTSRQQPEEKEPSTQSRLQHTIPQPQPLSPVSVVTTKPLSSLRVTGASSPAARASPKPVAPAVAMIDSPMPLLENACGEVQPRPASPPILQSPAHASRQAASTVTQPKTASTGFHGPVNQKATSPSPARSTPQQKSTLELQAAEKKAMAAQKLARKKAAQQQREQLQQQQQQLQLVRDQQNQLYQTQTAVNNLRIPQQMVVPPLSHHAFLNHMQAHAVQLHQDHLTTQIQLQQQHQQWQQQQFLLARDMQARIDSLVRQPHPAFSVPQPAAAISPPSARLPTSVLAPSVLPTTPIPVPMAAALAAAPISAVASSTTSPAAVPVHLTAVPVPDAPIRITPPPPVSSAAASAPVLPPTSAGAPTVDPALIMVHFIRFLPGSNTGAPEPLVSIRMKKKKQLAKGFKAFCDYLHVDLEKLEFFSSSQRDLAQERLKSDQSVYDVKLDGAQTPHALGWDRDQFVLAKAMA